MTTGSTGSFIPKWQLAVILGAPIAIGLGYLYFRKQSIDEFAGGDCGTEEERARTKIANLKGQTISLDGDDKLQPSSSPKPVETEVAAAAAAKNPLEQATAFKNEGNVCFKKGKYDEAINHYDKAIDACPLENVMDLSTFYQNRAAAYEQLKKWSAVRNDCSKALELNPRYVKALHRRARANEGLAEFMSSLEDITATCILEGFQNNSTLSFADRVLKQIGRNYWRHVLVNHF